MFILWITVGWSRENIFDFIESNRSCHKREIWPRHFQLRTEPPKDHVQVRWLSHYFLSNQFDQKSITYKKCDSQSCADLVHGMVVQEQWTHGVAFHRLMRKVLKRSCATCVRGTWAYCTVKRTSEVHIISMRLSAVPSSPRLVMFWK